MSVDWVGRTVAKASLVATLAVVMAFAASPLMADDPDGSLLRIKERGRLKVCAEKYALPFSSENPDTPGIDVEIARALAEALGVRLELVWLDTGSRGGHTALRRKILTKGCDCFVGMPVKEAREKNADITKPYLGTAFALVVPKGTPQINDLGDLEGLKVGASSNSPPWRVMYDMGWDPSFGYRFMREILDAVESGELDAGFVWGPGAAWEVHQHARPALEIMPAATILPNLRWNNGVALRRGELALKEAIELELDELVASGKLEAIVKKYGVSYFQPFEDLIAN